MHCYLQNYFHITQSILPHTGNRCHHLPQSSRCTAMMDGTKCHSHKPGRHSVCAIRTPLAENRKFSPSGKGVLFWWRNFSSHPLMTSDGTYWSSSCQLCNWSIQYQCSIYRGSWGLVRGGRTWRHVVATIWMLWLHSKGKNRECKLQGSLYGQSDDGRLVFSTKLSHLACQSWL